MREDDEDDVVMETTDVLSRKRKAVDDAASGDFITAKKLCPAETD